MTRHADRIARVEFDPALAPSIARLLDLLGEAPHAPGSTEAADRAATARFAAHGFELRPTGPRTTVFHDPASDCFFKILHPRLTLRTRAHALLRNRARQIHALVEWLIARDVPVPRVRAFGTIRQGRQPFYAVERVKGRSLYDLLVRERRALSPELARKVLDAVIRLHGLGYWLGDAHLSHVFVHEGEVSGFIDLDSVRENRRLRLSHIARDLAGLNHPGLSLARPDRASLLGYYADRANVDDARALRRLITRCSASRWKAWRPEPGAAPPGP